ncbi:hypothetical protein NDU88_001038 [Pleurodeles waltl]|uniref:Uncharacterized protein n=1 Tax=Pleurodeles waltl TaxID=8319 RepID=A0AAV7TI09_PLEWA|nr:hypothetical protein NDU88_001038 [Pleurodeles waltl]
MAGGDEYLSRIATKGSHRMDPTPPHAPRGHLKDLAMTVDTLGTGYQLDFTHEVFSSFLLYTMGCSTAGYWGETKGGEPFTLGQDPRSKILILVGHWGPSYP